MNDFFILDFIDGIGYILYQWVAVPTQNTTYRLYRLAVSSAFR